MGWGAQWSFEGGVGLVGRVGGEVKEVWNNDRVEAVAMAVVVAFAIEVEEVRDGEEEGKNKASKWCHCKKKKN